MQSKAFVFYCENCSEFSFLGHDAPFKAVSRLLSVLNYYVCMYLSGLHNVASDYSTLNFNHNCRLFV